MALFNRKKLQKMRPPTFNKLRELRIKIVQQWEGEGVGDEENKAREM